MRSNEDCTSHPKKGNILKCTLSISSKTIDLIKPVYLNTQKKRDKIQIKMSIPN